jgi:DNA mismatch endonuclease (patch repair protein)
MPPAGGDALAEGARCWELTQWKYDEAVVARVPDSPGPSRRSANMRAIRRRDTKPERTLRSALHRRGLRFRVDYPVPVAGRSPRPDIAFTRWRVAVFVDGCFWHGCPYHATGPKVNASYWGPKIARNVERDAQQAELLLAAGWTVLRVWEHDPIESSVRRITALIGGSKPAISPHEFGA